MDTKEELPPYYKPWMDIALRVPELVHSRQLRFLINKVGGDDKVTGTILYGAIGPC